MPTGKRVALLPKKKPAPVRRGYNCKTSWGIGSEGSTQSSVGTSNNCKLEHWKIEGSYCWRGEALMR